MDALFGRRLWQGAIALATAAFGFCTEAGIISGIDRPDAQLVRTNRVDELDAALSLSSLPRSSQASTDAEAVAWPTTGSSPVVRCVVATSIAAAPGQTQLLDLITGLSETGSHVVFLRGPDVDALAGVDRGVGVQRTNAGAFGSGNALSASATGPANAHTQFQRSTVRSASADDRDTSAEIHVTYAPSLLDSGSNVTGLSIGEQAVPLSRPFTSPPAFENLGQTPAIEPAGNRVRFPDAAFAAAAVVVSEPTSLLIVGAGLSGIIGVSLAAYGIKSQGARRRNRRDRAH